MQFDKETFKPWIFNLGLSEGWNNISIEQMEEFLVSKERSGRKMDFVRESIDACKNFMNAIAPAHLDGDDGNMISVLVKDGIVEGVSGPRFMRHEDQIVLQVGLTRYKTIVEGNKITVGGLEGNVTIIPITQKEGNKDVQRTDSNGNPRFGASARLMDSSDEESEVYEIRFSFTNPSVDPEGNQVKLTEPKLNNALKNGGFHRILNKSPEPGMSSNEDSVWFDMRMLPIGVYKVNKITDPKEKKLDTGTVVKKWYLEIDGIGMCEAHRSLVDDLEFMWSEYQADARSGDLYIRVVFHNVKFTQTKGGEKEVAYFPDFFHELEKGNVKPLEPGKFAGTDCKHYMRMTFATGIDYEFQPITQGVVNKALEIRGVREMQPALVGAGVSALPVSEPDAIEAEVVTVSASKADEDDYDSIPF